MQTAIACGEERTVGGRQGFGDKLWILPSRSRINLGKRSGQNVDRRGEGLDSERGGEPSGGRGVFFFSPRRDAEKLLLRNPDKSGQKVC